MHFATATSLGLAAPRVPISIGPQRLGHDDPRIISIDTAAHAERPFRALAEAGIHESSAWSECSNLDDRGRPVRSHGLRNHCEAELGVAGAHRGQGGVRFVDCSDEHVERASVVLSGGGLAALGAMDRRQVVERRGELRVVSPQHRAMRRSRLRRAVSSAASR